jgi:hypothetical protein
MVIYGGGGGAQKRGLLNGLTQQNGITTMIDMKNGYSQTIPPPGNR